MKKALKFIAWLLIIILLLVIALFTWLTVSEYKPEDVEDVTVQQISEAQRLTPGSTLSILTWNIGYAGLGEGSDFFMDGGENVKSADEDTVNTYLSGIYSTAFASDAQSDIYMFQEVDTDSTRTYHIDETNTLKTGNSTYALNYSCKYVPYPIPPIGKVNSGLLTVSNYEIESAERIQLPIPFSWPTRVANLKRCLLANYIPIEGTDKYLVVVDLHLEAYDDGEGKIAQTNQLKQFIQEEYEKGNYVIAGGDFNQIFPGGLDVFPNTHTDLWEPGLLDETMIPDGWSYAYDTSSATCRLLNQPYDPSDTENTQYYVIDGFIVSPNLTVNSVNTLQENFQNSDHNPVKITITLT